MEPANRHIATLENGRRGGERFAHPLMRHMPRILRQRTGREHQQEPRSGRASKLVGDHARTPHLPLAPPFFRYRVIPFSVFSAA